MSNPILAGIRPKTWAEVALCGVLMDALLSGHGGN